MKLVIHCGCHKTGTTSFQSFCTLNRALLRRFGIHYPEYRQANQHSYLMWEVKRHGLQTLATYLREVHAQALADCHTVLLSGEDFENCIVDLALASEIETLASEAGFEAVEWVVVHRAMADLVASLYAQKSRRGVVLNYDTIKTAATQRGCFYVSTAEYDYIHVLDYSRFGSQFRQHVRGEVTEYDFASFVQDYPGMILLKRLMSGNTFPRFYEEASFGKKQANKRLIARRVEENYIATALGLGPAQDRSRLLRALLAPLVQLRLRKTS